MINIKIKKQLNIDFLKKVATVLLLMHIALTLHKAFLSPERMLFREGLVLQKMKYGYFSKELTNLCPFSTIVNYFNNYEVFGFRYWFINVWGNILFFLPYGFLGPLVFDKIRNKFGIVLFALAIPMGIEVLQEIFSLGIYDVDDIILNFFGILVGYVFLILFLRRIEDFQ
ncbi:MAG: VanZ family protein [Firmicutes bacterium]|jgi:glycopeptide antibiotics resistance protein|nr:VanZ family protein [Bacillota bacterium]